MTTVGELRKFLEAYGDHVPIAFLAPSRDVKGLEVVYEITTNTLRVRPVLNQQAFLIPSGGN